MQTSPSPTLPVPSDARLLPLASGTKVPVAGSRGHHSATKDFTPAPGANYGIALDGQFLVVDIDDPDKADILREGTLPETWSQRTRRGFHFLYRVPPGLQGRNIRIPGGDVKIHGYIVGPGSVVDGFEYKASPQEPAPAPSFLLEQVSTAAPQDSPAIEEQDGIPEGHDQFLHTLASWLRGRYALSAPAIARVLSEGPVSVLLGGRDEDPYTQKDFERIAKSVAKYDATEADAVLLNPESWVTALDVDIVGPPTEWWVHGFVPQNELVMVYGQGGIGKSTWGSWLAAEVTKKKGRFAFVGVEEPFERFAGRALLNGARGEYLFSVPTAGSLSLPANVKALSEACKALEISVLYFDSIYAHFDSLEGTNAAERARKCLSPLAEMAQSLGVTIIGVFHENKMGQYLGSTEMRNVGRVMLHATREEHRPLKLSVSKTNFRKPDYALEFIPTETPLVDMTTGETQMERDKDGKLAPELVTIVKEVHEVGGRQTHVIIDDIVPAPEDTVREYFEEHPAASLREAADALGMPKSSIHRLSQKTVPSDT